MLRIISSFFLLQALLFCSFSLAQQGTNRTGCNANDTLPVSFTRSSYANLNATGSLTVTGFGPEIADDFGKQWTWYNGVQAQPRSPLITRPIWVDTHGTDLASPDTPYNLCYIVLDGINRSTQQRAQGDNGNCNKMLGKQCAEDWGKLLASSPFNATISGNISSPDFNPCRAPSRAPPDSCKDFKSRTVIHALFPPKERTCPFGLGDPDYDMVTRLAYGSGLEPDRSVPAASNETYDLAVTSIVPIFVLAWSKPSNGSNWAAPRVMCLSTPNITENSRKAAGVPSAAVRISRSGIGGVLGLMVAISVAL